MAPRGLGDEKNLIYGYSSALRAPCWGPGRQNRQSAGNQQSAGRPTPGPRRGWCGTPGVLSRILRDYTWDLVLLHLFGTPDTFKGVRGVNGRGESVKI